MRDVPSYWPSVRYLFRFLIVLSLPCLAAVCTTRRSVEQRHGLTATRQLPVHAQTVMLHVVDALRSEWCDGGAVQLALHVTLKAFHQYVHVALWSVGDL